MLTDEQIYTPLTRGQLAELLITFAEKILQREYMFDETCASSSFTDSQQWNDESQQVVEKVCSL